MNKKSVLTFLTGIVLGALGLFFVNATLHKSPSPAHSTVSVPALPAIAPVHSPQNAAPVPGVSSGAVALPSADTAVFRSLLSKEPDAYSMIYEIKKGDSLASAAKAHGTTVDLLKRINGLSSDRLSVGQKLKIPNAKFNVVIDKSQNSLILKVNEDVLKTYVVSTGVNNSTPVGVFKVTNKLVNPTWYKSGAVVPYGSPANVLGTRWIGLTKKGYGIHGTVEPEKLGQQVTAGCVRMKNEEVEELFGFVVPGTEVTIVN